MTALLYICSVFCSSGQSALGKQYAKLGGNSLTFNINKALAGSVLFLIIGLAGGFAFHLPTIPLAVGYGVLFCISMHTGFKALSIGPMSLTSTIASFSLIIPLLFGVCFWDEKLTCWNMAGIVLLLGSILLINAKKEKGFSVEWMIYTLITLVSNGIFSVIQKVHQMRFPGLYRTEFMFWALFSVLVILSLTSLSRPSENFRLSFGWWGLAAGVLNCLSNYIVLYLSAAENASVLFPIVSVANIMMVWMIGIVFFKERLKLTQVLGLIIGVTSVVLLKL